MSWTSRILANVSRRHFTVVTLEYWLSTYISASIWPLISKASKDLIITSSSSVPEMIHDEHWTPLSPFLTSGHLLCEESDHLGEVDGSRGLPDQVVGLGVWDGSTDADEGGLQIVGGDDAILVNVDDAESLLELLDLFLTEQGEDVGTRLLGLLWSFSWLKRRRLYFHNAELSSSLNYSLKMHQI